MYVSSSLINILALDPSTEATGIMLVTYTPPPVSSLMQKESGDVR
jgi:hypothetical protein